MQMPLSLSLKTQVLQQQVQVQTEPNIHVVVRIRNQSLYIRTAIISVIIYNDRYSWFLYIMANFFQSVYIMTEILVCL